MVNVSQGKSSCRHRALREALTANDIDSQGGHDSGYSGFAASRPRPT